MNEQEILEGNKLIAEYMGALGKKLKVYQRYDGETFCADITGTETPPYNNSWNWLMPVVLKILKEQNGENAFVFNWAATDWFCSIYSNKGQPYNNTDNNPILAVWNSVVQYLKNK